MTQIIVRTEIADQIRSSEGPIELIDEKGVRVGIVRRPPTSHEIEVARSRVGEPGPKFTVEELIAKVEAS
jgi:hypothetical protein